LRGGKPMRRIATDGQRKVSVVENGREVGHIASPVARRGAVADRVGIRCGAILEYNQMARSIGWIDEFRWPRRSFGVVNDLSLRGRYGHLSAMKRLGRVHRVFDAAFLDYPDPLWKVGAYRRTRPFRSLDASKSFVTARSTQHSLVGP
jgi:hypothetical protein